MNVWVGVCVYVWMVNEREGERQCGWVGERERWVNERKDTRQCGWVGRKMCGWVYVGWVGGREHRRKCG